MAKDIITYTSDKTKESKTLTEWARSIGANPSTLYCRLKRGMSIDEALEASTNPKSTPYENVTDPISGETHSLVEWAEITGIPYHSLYTRIHKHNWPVEKVLYGKKFETVTRKPRPKDTYTHIDLSGKRFGKLTVVERADEDYIYGDPNKPKRMWKWVCKCDCGETVTVIQNNLTRGRTKSCKKCNTADNKFKDITGMKFGHLTVIERAPDKIVCGEKVVHWYCKCDCGNPEMVSVSGHNLRNGHTTSCGCGINKITHGKYGTRLYKIYRGMITRCENPNSPSYPRYGGRGISICKEWREDGIGFMNFYDWAISNGYSDELSIDRIDNDRGYSPDNCRWATATMQANNRSTSAYITYAGVTKTATEWARDLGVESATLISRRNKGWPDDDIIEIPINYLFNQVMSSSGNLKTISEWSDISGINRSTLYDRIFRCGWNTDRALLTGATNPEIFNHVSPASAYAFQNPSYVQPSTPPAIYYIDVLGRYYTPEEWDAHQGISFD